MLLNLVHYHFFWEVSPALVRIAITAFADPGGWLSRRMDIISRLVSQGITEDDQVTRVGTRLMMVNEAVPIITYVSALCCVVHDG